MKPVIFKVFQSSNLTRKRFRVLAWSTAYRHQPSTSLSTSSMCSCLNCQRMALYPEEDRSNYPPPQTHYTSYFQTQSYYTAPSPYSTPLSLSNPTPFEYPPVASTSSYQPPVYYPNPSQSGQYSLNPSGLAVPLPHSTSASPLLSPEHDWSQYPSVTQTRPDSTLYPHPHRPELATHPPLSPLRTPSFEESSVGQRSHSDPQLLMAPPNSSAPTGDRVPQRRASGGSIVEGPSSRRGSTLSTLNGYTGLPATSTGDEGDSSDIIKNESITVSSAFSSVAVALLESQYSPRFLAFSHSYQSSPSF